MEEQNEPDIVWCRSVFEQLDSAASACVVEISELEAECADDFAWMQSPRVRVRIFVSSTPRLLALVAGAAPSLRLEEIRIFLCFAPSLSMLRGYNLASQSLGSLPSTAPSSSASRVSRTPSCTSFGACPCQIALRWPACRGWRGRGWAVSRRCLSRREASPLCMRSQGWVRHS